MPIPRIAIVGRPNAGKSSLINLIAGAKVSIVDPTPGVTRDRVCAIVDLQPPDGKGPVKPAEFIDTGGFGVYTAEGQRYDEIGADLGTLTTSIEQQIQRAVEDADLILLAVDAQQGVTPADETIAKLLRRGSFQTKRGARAATPTTGVRHRAPVRVVATKVDGPKWEAHAVDLASLGFGEALLCSAKNNYMRRDFLDAVYGLLPAPGAKEAPRPADLLLAVLGKRNAGKSTLVNTLAGEERMIVSEIAGTTRDAVDVRIECDGRSLVVIDTAGLRRRRSFQDAIEHYAFDRTQRAVDRADVVLLLLDATAPISQVDEQIGQLVQKSYKPAIIVVNKWDLVEGSRDEKGKPVTIQRYEEYIRRELRGLWFAPIAFIEAASGRNLRQTVDLASELKEQSERRVTTGKLNRLVRAIIETRGPTDTTGTQAKVYYVAQTGVCPPTITLVVNHPELFTPNYLRFLVNRFREELGFDEVPIRVVVRARRQREDDLARDAEHAGAAPKRGRRGVDVRARRSARRHAEAPVPGELTDEELLKEFGEDLLTESRSHAVDTGWDAAVESGDFGDAEKANPPA